MTWTNYNDVINQLMDAGFCEPVAGWDAAIDCGKKTGIRCKVEGSRQGGAIALHTIRLDDGRSALIGAGWYYIGAEKHIVKLALRVDSKPAKLSDDLRAAIKARQQEMAKMAEAERAREIEKASRKASGWWRKLDDAGQSGYMKKKGFDAHELFGARISPSGNLAVPVQDTTGKIYGLQIIYPTKEKNGRDKDFTPSGLGKKGNFYQIGLVQRGGVVLLCEGFATGASLRKATGLPVVVAFDAGNLTTVAQVIHKAHRKDVKILVCADDDYLTEHKTGKNPGRDAASTAALAVDGCVVWPQFPDERPMESKGPTDFNDLHVHPGGGLPVVRTQIEEALTTAGWRAPKRVAAGLGTQGGGETRRAENADDDPRPAAVSVMLLDDLVDRFVPVDDGSGKVLFDQWTKRIVQKTQMVELFPAGVRSDDVKRHPVWVGRGAVYVDQIGFDPAGEEKHVRLNTWRGWPMSPKKGSCENLVNLIHGLCNNEGPRPDLVHWFFCWLAYPLQNPGAKMQSAIILHGKQGTGKSTVFKVMAEIYGDRDSYRNYAVILDQRALESQFNSDWDSKLFVVAEEVINSSDKWALKNELKELVTGHRIRIQKKFLDAYYQTNRCNMVFLSNEDAPLPLDNDDRRHCVIWTPPAFGESVYVDVRREIANGGVEAFYDYLMNYDVGDFKPWTKPPMTEAKQALIDASRSSEDEFFTDWINGETPYPVCPCRGGDLFEAYIRHCQKLREKNIATRRRFRIKLAHMHDWQHRKQTYVYENYHFDGDAKQVRLEIPGESWMTKNIATVDYRHKPGEPISVWATRCMLDFSKSLEAETALKAA